MWKMDERNFQLNYWWVFHFKVYKKQIKEVSG